MLRRLPQQPRVSGPQWTRKRRAQLTVSRCAHTRIECKPSTERPTVCGEYPRIRRRSACLSECLLLSSSRERGREYIALSDTHPDHRNYTDWTRLARLVVLSDRSTDSRFFFPFFPFAPRVRALSPRDRIF